ERPRGRRTAEKRDELSSAHGLPQHQGSHPTISLQEHRVVHHSKIDRRMAEMDQNRSLRWCPLYDRSSTEGGSASAKEAGFNCTTPAASSGRAPPSQPRASARSRKSACGLRGGHKPASHSHGWPTGAAAAFMMRQTTPPSASASKSSSFHSPDGREHCLDQALRVFPSPAARPGISGYNAL